MKKIMAMLLATTMVISLSACASQEAPTEDDTNTSTSESTSTTEDTTPAVDYYKMPELTTIHTGKVTGNLDQIYPPESGYTPSENPMYDLFESSMNIELVNDIEADYVGYLQQINQGTLTGRIPEIFFADANMIPGLIENDLIVDMTPYVEQYATDELKEQLNCYDGINLEMPTMDGGLYALPEILSRQDGNPVLWINEEWFNNVKDDLSFDTATGLESIDTIEKLYEVATAFTKNDPDGNGQDDTFGLPLNLNVNEMMMPIFAAYGVYTPEWDATFGVDENGNYRNMSFEPGMIEALTDLNELYNEGVIDPEFGTKNSWDVEPEVTGGKYGIYIGKFFHSTFVTTYQSSPHWNAIAIPPAEGYGPYKPFTKPNNAGYYVVSKECTNPEALVIIMNNTISTDSENEFNKGKEVLESDPANSQLLNWMPIKCQTYDDSIRAMEAYKMGFEGDESALLSKDMGNYTIFQSYLAQADNPPAADDESFVDFANSANLYKAFFIGVDKVAYQYPSDNEDVFVTGWVKPKTDKMADSVIAGYVNSEKSLIVQIISGQKTIADWEAYEEEWHANGGDELLAELKELS